MALGTKGNKKEEVMTEDKSNLSDSGAEIIAEYRRKQDKEMWATAASLILFLACAFKFVLGMTLFETLVLVALYLIVFLMGFCIWLINFIEMAVQDLRHYERSRLGLDGE